MNVLARSTKALFGLKTQVLVFEYERGLLYREGKFERVLTAGVYRFWRWENVYVQVVNMRVSSQIITGQEMLTADNVDVRLSLVAQYNISDPVLAIHTVENYLVQIHQDLQLALREAVSARTLEELLKSRSELSGELLVNVIEKVKVYGIALLGIGVRDIVLPKAVRDIMLQELEAERAGRADLVRARHEVAAARARANTAKLMSDNPQIMHLHELDALVKMAEKQGQIVVFPSLGRLFSDKN